jgi:hypothetical protein
VDQFIASRSAALNNRLLYSVARLLSTMALTAAPTAISMAVVLHQVS